MHQGTTNGSPVRALQPVLSTNTHRTIESVLDMDSVLTAEERDVRDHDETVARSQSPELLAEGGESPNAMPAQPAIDNTIWSFTDLGTPRRD